MAVIDGDRCKPKKCNHECMTMCPVNRIGKRCVDIEDFDNRKKATISESLCIGCGQCVKVCPFNAVVIVNLPGNLSKLVSHRYGRNSFRLHRLPVPIRGQCLGIIGGNGSGKSTSVNILSGRLVPNLGMYKRRLHIDDVIDSFKGSELHGYLKDIESSKLRVSNKPQYNVQFRKVCGEHTVEEILRSSDERDEFDQWVEVMNLSTLIKRRALAKELSGGELQRVAIAITCMKNVQVYIYDEPTSFLDIRERFRMAEALRRFNSRMGCYMVVVDHDLMVLDYLSDRISYIYGVPNVYGVVTRSSSTKEAVNEYLDGYNPHENVRFRDHPMMFNITDEERSEASDSVILDLPEIRKTLGLFTIDISPNKFNAGEITVLLGENGIGKTTYIRLIAGVLQCDNTKIPEMNISLKPQTLRPKFTGKVSELLHQKISSAILDKTFYSNVALPLGIDELSDLNVQELSGGELQKVAIILALGKPADIYLLDEPSAYLDSESRLKVGRVIKRFIRDTRKAAFIVEHDLMLGMYLADKMIVFEGKPGIYSRPSGKLNVPDAIDLFLKTVSITLRTDPDTSRPRINKYGSVKDTEQKRSGEYFLIR